MVHIDKEQFEKLLSEYYGAKSIACYFGVSCNTLGAWVKKNYDGKTFKQLYLERGLGFYGKNKNE